MWPSPPTPCTPARNPDRKKSSPPSRNTSLTAWSSLPVRRVCTSPPSAVPWNAPGSTSTCLKWPISANTCRGSARTRKPTPTRPRNSSASPLKNCAATTRCSPSPSNPPSACSSSAAAWPASRPPSTAPTRASTCSSWNAKATSAARWRSSTRPSLPSTAPAASSAPRWSTSPSIPKSRSWPLPK